jgi:hypothetical protein
MLGSKVGKWSCRFRDFPKLLVSHTTLYKLPAGIVSRPLIYSALLFLEYQCSICVIVGHLVDLYHKFNKRKYLRVLLYYRSECRIC